METYAERLRYAIQLAKESDPDISQSELARRVGIKPQAIQYLCTNDGTKEKRSKYTQEIAKVLKVNPQWLATGAGNPKSQVLFSKAPHKQINEDHPEYGDIQQIARQKAMEFTDKYERNRDEPFDPVVKMAIFDIMTERYKRLLQAGQEVPEEKDMDAEVIEFAELQKLASKK